MSVSGGPSHGQHFLKSVAGNDLRLAFLVTCGPTLAIAGLVGIFGARWMKDDIAAAERADKLAKSSVSLRTNLRPDT